jgi:hypothetical protein
MPQLVNSRPLAAGIMALVAACSQGCGGGGTKGETPVVDREATLGTWIEDPEAAASGNPRFKAPPPRTKNLRQITVKDDETYVLEMVTRSGEPAGDGKVEGSWKISGGYMIFESSANGLPQDLQTMAPTRTKGRDVSTGDDGKPYDVLNITDEDGAPVVFVRKP